MSISCKFLRFILWTNLNTEYSKNKKRSVQKFRKFSVGAIKDEAAIKVAVRQLYLTDNQVITKKVSRKTLQSERCYINDDLSFYRKYEGYMQKLGDWTK